MQAPSCTLHTHLLEQGSLRNRQQVLNNLRIRLRELELVAVQQVLRTIRNHQREEHSFHNHQREEHSFHNLLRELGSCRNQSELQRLLGR